MMENTTKTAFKKTSTGRPSILTMIVRDKLALVGLIIVVAFFGWGLVQGLMEILAKALRDQALGYALLPHNPFVINITDELKPPSLNHLMGTNALGEDVLSRILYAIPRDAIVAVSVVLSAIFIGAVLGISAGYLGKVFNDVIMRLTDAFLALPALIMVIAISEVLRGSFEAVIFALMLVWWPTYTRFFRAETIRIRNLDFVLASKLNKVSRIKFFYRYLLKNSLDPIIAYAALDFGNVILTYATLAFLGIGIVPRIPELGEMASKGLGYLPNSWWYSVFPGVTILIIVIGFVLLGDRLQEIFANRENR